MRSLYQCIPYTVYFPLVICIVDNGSSDLVADRIFILPLGRKQLLYGTTLDSEPQDQDGCPRFAWSHLPVDLVPHVPHLCVPPEADSDKCF